MHQAVRQGSVGCKDQEACSRQIKSSDCNPASALEWRQGIENELAPLRVVTTGDLVTGLVIDDVAVYRRRPSYRERATVKSDFLRPIDMIAELGDFAINSETTLSYPGFVSTVDVR